MMGTEQGCPDYQRLRFLYGTDPQCRLPAYLGSAWRGAFGRALREAVCATGQKQCQGCPLISVCPYAYLFETLVERLPNGNRNTHAPHPLVMELFPHEEQPPSPDRYALGICLIGKAMEWLHLVILAMQRAGERGIAGNRNRFRLLAVEQHDGTGWQPIFHPGGTLRPLAVTLSAPEIPEGPAGIELTTPLRIQHHGRILGPAELCPRFFVQALFHRFSQLSLLHGGGDAPPEPWPAIPPESPFLAAGLHWKDLDRYSSRQERKHPIGGVLGRFTLDLTGLEAAWPLLWHGQFLHIGKLSSLGHGGYRISDRKLAGRAVETEMPQNRNTDQTIPGGICQ
ncbi:MAG: CRISPR system precrRNA processing endoribonuclease RAMP protein Cas6 [Gammaproteobacteria bacterium]|nr:CRISPR system precrRNA processing endoribonuclease RAMP protein Cas6 [Gammaproteobacteria bacterium]MBU1655928.1 CRISPR system precrRNA processing endoribonuclease RAMP protein Cas6 [Gammaproteobacteria bacterium]MBU1961800.1 CRISPR system precrRNA processing endoribonuclease RAMP protein Cas6 [Gammaproteobacteria bacterium]